MFPRSKGRGLGTLVTASVIEYCREAGMTTLQMEAISQSGVEATGHQVWPLLGFTWSREEHAEIAKRGFLREVTRRYGTDSDEVARAQGLHHAWDFSAFTDQGGTRVGFELMHLRTLDPEVQLPQLVPMVRKLGAPGWEAAEAVWQQTLDRLKKKFDKTKKTMKGWP